LQGDTRLIIVAGSDTTAATLVHLFYHLATDKVLTARLRRELDALLEGDVKMSHAQIQDAPLLNAVINETLRLHPPVPSGVFRKTPPEGIDIGGTHVPGNTAVQLPLYAMGRDPSIWPDADVFIPERFIEPKARDGAGVGEARREKEAKGPDLMPYKDVFSPFSTGPYSCIGKNLALMEIRLLTAQLVTRFDVRLADGETGAELLGESKDHFTVGLGALRLCFDRISRT